MQFDKAKGMWNVNYLRREHLETGSKLDILGRKGLAVMNESGEMEAQTSVLNMLYEKTGRGRPIIACPHRPQTSQPASRFTRAVLRVVRLPGSRRTARSRRQRSRGRIAGTVDSDSATCPVRAARAFGSRSSWRSRSPASCAEVSIRASGPGCQ